MPPHHPQRHPEFDLRPIVIDPLHTPDPQGASPYLVLFTACVNALTMETKFGASQVLAAIRDTGASIADRKRLTTIILEVASARFWRT